jgi:mRNA interferase MazF
MPRGDVVAIADRAGDFTGKPRPAVIVQNDVFREIESVTVCPLTSFAADAPLLRLELTSSETLSLDRISWIEVDKITTVRRNRIGRTIGRLSASDLVRLNGALAVFLGLG